MTSSDQDREPPADGLHDVASEFKDIGEARPPATRAIIHEVLGRGSSSEKGLAPLHSVSAGAANGTTFSFGRIPPSGNPVPLRVHAAAEPQRFAVCAICMDPDPDSKEHVPPESVGGRRMTNTCRQCNNRFGTLIDRALTDWYDDAFVPVRVSHPEVAGARKTSRVLRRQTPAGEFVLIPEGYFDPAIGEQMGPNETLDFEFTIPDPDRVALAILKSAYLSACLLVRSVLDTPEAAQVRKELMAVRDLNSSDPVGPLGLAARSIRFTKSDGTNADRRLTLVEVPADGARDGWFGISMAGTILASWVFGGHLVFVTDDQPVVQVALGGLPTK